MSFDINSQTTFGDADGLRNFFLSHAITHRQFATAISANTGRQMPGVNLYDTQALEIWIQCMQNEDAKISDPLQSWLESHDALHQAELSVFGQSGIYDLTGLDPRQANQFYDWMLNHQAVHDYEAQQLKVTI